jgi:hypothetical protein
LSVWLCATVRKADPACRVLVPLISSRHVRRSALWPSRAVRDAFLVHCQGTASGEAGTLVLEIVCRVRRKPVSAS